MLSFKGKKLLVIAPHPDDEIFGCGGLIARFKREGGQVYVLYLTVGTTRDFSGNGLSTEEERQSEIKAVAEYLSFDGWKMAFPGNEYHLQLDGIPQKRLIDEIERGDTISLEVIKPDVVATTSVYDYNQDHRATANAALTATRPTPPDFKSFQPLVIAYELPPSAWRSGHVSVENNLYVSLSEEDFKQKTTALGMYKSQLKNSHGPLSLYGVETLARMRGIESGVTLAEAFSLNRLLT
ncbi:MAG: PIG-L family deacetylase [bacterium]|nr:PIG-L family deacetylase [bacterium]